MKYKFSKTQIKAYKFILLGLLTFYGCGLAVTRPKLEMSLAANAYIAAKESGAPNHSPDFFRRAETYYLKAKSAYRRKYFDKAKKYALLSKKYSEKAEFEAIKKKTLNRSGEL